MSNDLATLSGMAGLSGAYARIEEEDKFVYGLGRPFLPNEYAEFVSQFDKIEENSKGDYDEKHPWLPITMTDLTVRLILGEEVMHWALGQDDIGNEIWFRGEEQTLLFLRGSLMEAFQPENNVAHGILCLEQSGYDYSIRKEDRKYRVSINNRWVGSHPLSREKAVVNALLLMAGKESEGYIVKGEEEKEKIVHSVPVSLDGTLRALSVPFSRR